VNDFGSDPAQYPGYRVSCSLLGCIIVIPETIKDVV